MEINYTSTLKEPLNNESGTEWMDSIRNLCMRVSLPILVLFSNMGMVLIKTGERTESISTLIIGLSLECMAFVIYPVSMRIYSLRTITVSWSGGSTITAIGSGYILFDEIPTKTSLIGCVVVIIGIFATVFG